MLTVIINIVLALGAIVFGLALCIFLTFGEKRDHHVIETDAKVVIGIMVIVWLAFTISFFVRVFM